MSCDLRLVAFWLFYFGANLKQWQMANNGISDFATSVSYC